MPKRRSDDIGGPDLKENGSATYGAGGFGASRSEQRQGFIRHDDPAPTADNHRSGYGQHEGFVSRFPYPIDRY